MGESALRAGLALDGYRRESREVAIGDVRIGAGHPIAVQSMTTTFTADAEATAAQVIELARAGCEIVRVTVPSKRDAAALPGIRERMRQAGVSVPLVADIHFTPKLALQVVEHVEKVRINPGNFVDRKSLTGGGYDDGKWEEDLERAYEMFAPVVDRARELGVALRIGTNHGSLSDRILHRYGDTPDGMVASALEFVRIAEDRGHRDIVLSMKASNVQVMVRAYRLLADTLESGASGLYPLHLGVTEAGGGDDGRIKSAAGIATLLAEGLGDTIRVSLTENPVHEVPVGRALVDAFARPAEGPAPVTIDLEETRQPLDPRPRETAEFRARHVAWGGRNVPRVEVVCAPGHPDLAAEVRGVWPPVEVVDLRVAGDHPDWTQVAASLPDVPDADPESPVWAVTADAAAVEALLADGESWGRLRSRIDRLGVVFDDDLEGIGRLADRAPGVPVLALRRVSGPTSRGQADRIVAFARELAGRAPDWAAGLEPGAGSDATVAYRVLCAALDRAGARLPVVLADRPALDGDDLRLTVTGRLSALLLDGQGDAVRLPADRGGVGQAARLAHAVLQACRKRLEQAEYIACPSCGRTRFELEETTERIRGLTSHLKLKIGVMGCVVNGPGEMADADYGFVGWGEGRVALFVGREMVEKDIPYDAAPGRLVELIKSRGDWTEPRASGHPSANSA